VHNKFYSPIANKKAASKKSCFFFVTPIFLIISLFTLISCGLEGKVVRVSDGDTLVILDKNNTEHKIRLAQIDAPELNQPWGKKSKQSLSDLVMHKKVEITVVDKDDYGRTVGTVFIDNKDVCKEQIALGYAWVYRHHLKDNSLLAIEDEAKKNKRGLWKDFNPTPPWVWRKKNKENR
jgi:endonuclease YncB( thermonuclease family)